ncbi:MAG: diguanylate cyclase [Desulfobacteraceae bacterium]|nr:diguanylate cyclase [Desulfobacteraceae bacterium]
MEKKRITQVPVWVAMACILFVLAPMGIWYISNQYQAYENEINGLESRFLSNTQQELQHWMDSFFSTAGYYESRLDKRVKWLVKSQVNAVDSMLEAMIHKFKGDGLDFSNLRHILGSLRYGDGAGYYFAFSLDGILQVYPPAPGREGRNVLDYTDGDGRFVYRDMIDIALKKGEGFYRYKWDKPGSHGLLESAKIAYVKLVKPLSWVIATGIDFDKIQKEMQAEFLGVMETSLLGTGEYAFAMDGKGRILLNNLPELAETSSRLSGMILERSTREPNGSFVDLPGKMDETGKVESKLIYVRRHTNWGWIMGFGMGKGKVDSYVIDSIAKLRKEERQVFWLMGSLLVLISVAVFLLGHFFRVRIERNFAVFERFFLGAGSSGKKIDVAELGFHEFVALAHEANAMMEARRKNEMVIKSYTSKLKQVNKRLKAMSLKDGLTGVANRRRFDAVLQREWDRAMRTSDPISLIMMDIDFFKAYNDTYGHQKGDECLKRVARVLQDSVKRSTDLMARYGGEEFAAIVPDTPGEGVLAIAREIRERLAKENISHKGSAIGSRVTLSMGLATLVPSPGDSPETLVECADKALYRAKSLGRDRVEVSGAEDGVPGA